MSHTKSKRKPAKTNAHGLRIPRVARALVDPIRHAIEGAAKPSAANIKQIVQALELAGNAMREGVATAGDWGVIAGALDMSIAIERGGIVRGLMGHFEASQRVLQTIHDRAMATGQWQRTALWYYELDELATFIDLHTYQLGQLSRGELEQALDRAIAKIRSEGCTVDVVRSRDILERLAA
jgi:hypothetical protein